MLFLKNGTGNLQTTDENKPLVSADVHFATFANDRMHMAKSLKKKVKDPFSSLELFCIDVTRIHEDVPHL